MTRPIRVTAIYNKEPLIRLYVLAPISLARQLQREENQVAGPEFRAPGPEWKESANV